jgi:hypothetical protein
LRDGEGGGMPVISVRAVGDGDGDGEGVGGESKEK